MGRRKAASTLVCVAGQPIAKELKPDRPEFLRNGYCQACGEGPLHSPHNSNCRCSYLRARRRLCKPCAVAYDYVTKGHTRIEAAPFNPQEWREFSTIHARGVRAVLQRRD